MDGKEIWICSIKAKVLENCELNEDGSEFQFVECLFLTEKAEEMIAEIKSTLTSMRLELVKLSQPCIYRPEQWQDNSDPLIAEFIEAAAYKAKTQRSIAFSAFTSSNFLSGEGISPKE